MSKFPIGIVVLGVSWLFLVLATAPSSTAQARSLHMRIGGGPIGIVRSVASLAFRGLHGRRGERVRMATLHDEAPGALARADVTRGADWVTKPVARVQVGAAAALAGWHGRRGASGWWQLRHITIPLLKPAILVALIFRTLDAFRVFDLIYVMTGGGPGTSTEPVALYTFNSLLQNLEFGYGAALSVIIFLVTFGLAMVYMRGLGLDLGSPRTRR